MLETVNRHRIKGSMRTESGDKIIKHAKQSRLPAQLCVERAYEAHERSEGENGDIEPVEFVVPDLPAEGRKSLLCP